MLLRFAYVIENEFVLTLRDSGVEIDIVDNDHKAYSKTMEEAFENLGSNLAWIWIPWRPEKDCKSYW